MVRVGKNKIIHQGVDFPPNSHMLHPSVYQIPEKVKVLRSIFSLNSEATRQKNSQCVFIESQNWYGPQGPSLPVSMMQTGDILLTKRDSGKHMRCYQAMSTLHFKMRQIKIKGNRNENKRERGSLNQDFDELIYLVLGTEI